MGCRIRVLIADSNEEYRLLMRPVIERGGVFEVVADTGNGDEALELARTLRPDILVTDVVLNGLDGFSLMRQADGLVRVSVVVTAHATQQVLLRAIEEGVRHLLVKPFAEEELPRLLYKAMGMVSASSPCRDAMIREALRTLGIPMCVKGYHYTCRAIAMVMENPERVHAVTKELYPALAREFGTTATCVERNIRSALEQAWAHGDMEVQRRFFGSTLSVEGDRPSNRAFLAAVAEQLTRGTRYGAA
ncbi:MAG: response regulator [Oscillospiraceae bacterium]|nr:response regulator [Oscillospiraceae bacterium]